MQKILLFVLITPFSLNAMAQPIITVRPGASIYLSASSELTIDSLYMKPNWPATIGGGTTISRTTVPANPNSYATIAKLYHFSGGAISFRGRLQINYNENELKNITESSLRLNYFDGAAWKYLTSNYSLAPIDNYLTANTIDMINFSELTLGTQSAVLPLTWGRISGKCEGEYIRLKWETLQELQTSHFIIERSVDGQHWSAIAQKSAAGNSSTPRQYSIDDANINSAVAYYRIRIIDLDGTYSYSGSIPVQRCGSADKINVYPVPAGNATNLYLHAQLPFKSELSILSTDGKLLRRTALAVQAGSNQFPVDLSAFAAGVYYIRVTMANGQVQVLRITKSY